MARPRAFEVTSAAGAARDAFWALGYEAASMTDLEAATGLSRSSIYQAFGSKRALFDAALDHYLAHQMDPLLRPLEREGAGPADLHGYLAGMAAAFRHDGPLAARGCLVVNTMAELADRDAAARTTAAGYQHRVTAAFANALRNSSPATDADGAGAVLQARILYAAVVGALVMSHVDREAAASLCEDLADQLVP